jgi:hypothetical protein
VGGLPTKDVIFWEVSFIESNQPFPVFEVGTNIVKEIITITKNKDTFFFDDTDPSLSDNFLSLF